MQIVQLNPPLPMSTPKGDGYAYFMIDFGQDHHLQWVVFLDENGECWSFENPYIRMQKNYTMGRLGQSAIKNPGETPG